MHDATGPQAAAPGLPAVALVGNPNVGKSVVFGFLTGKYAAVSNYPGTTVEVSSGIATLAGEQVEVIDTPGVNSLIPRSEDEEVTRAILFERRPRAVVQVIDAKNLGRGLIITSQLAELGLPVVMLLNMWDEATERGIAIDADRLSRALGVPVVSTVATVRRGLGAIAPALSHAAVPRLATDFGPSLEAAASQLEQALPPQLASRRGIALMLLAGDAELEGRLLGEEHDLAAGLPVAPVRPGRRRRRRRGQLPPPESAPLPPPGAGALRGRVRIEAGRGLAGAGSDLAGQILRIRTEAQAKAAQPLSFLIGRIRAARVELLVRDVCSVRRPRQVSPLATGLFLYLAAPLLGFAVSLVTAGMIAGAIDRFSAPRISASCLPAVADGAASFFRLSLDGTHPLPRGRHAESVAVTIAGAPAPEGAWTLTRDGALAFEQPPAAGTAVRAAFTLHPGWPGMLKWGLALLGAAVYWACVLRRRTQAGGVRSVLGQLTMHPVLAVPVLAAVLWAVYQLVGVVGAGYCVDFLEHSVFGSPSEPAGGFSLFGLHVPFDGLNYHLAGILERIAPRDSVVFQLLLDDQAGLVSVGLRYAFALVLPIVVFFFLAFALLEDSGYLPRLAVMADWLFRVVGLNGKAVLPMVLGLGCDTMATLTTRILDTRRERVIATLLLALAIPCSAQMGIVSAVLADIGGGAAVAFYAAVIASQFLLVGWLASKVLPGRRSDFLLEVPPFRLPQFGNVLVKTWHHVAWFMNEAVPLFLLGTLALFILTRIGYNEQTRPMGLLSYADRVGQPVTRHLLGLPDSAEPGAVGGQRHSTTEAFVLGFLRRDYGAASIRRNFADGFYSARQAMVTLVVITLFVPCLANLLVIVKERGLRTAALIVGFIIPYSFIVGGAVNWLLKAFGGW